MALFSSALAQLYQNQMKYITKIRDKFISRMESGKGMTYLYCDLICCLKTYLERLDESERKHIPPRKSIPFKVFFMYCYFLFPSPFPLFNTLLKHSLVKFLVLLFSHLSVLITHSHLVFWGKQPWLVAEREEQIRRTNGMVWQSNSPELQNRDLLFVFQGRNFDK